jgi:hypothetical protein
MGVYGEMNPSLLDVGVLLDVNQRFLNDPQDMKFDLWA